MLGFILNELIKQSNLSFGQRQFRRRFWSRSADHRQPEDSPAQDAKD